MSRLIPHQVSAIWSIGFGLVVGLGIGRAHGAEQLFTDDVRIKAATPRLFLESTGLRTWKIDAGSAYFRIGNVTSNTVPVYISSLAPIYSLVVGTSGKVGLGTIYPGAHLHLLAPAEDTNVALRLEVDNAAVDAWDIGSNLSGFGLYDVDSDTKPFAVAAGTPTNTLYLSELGNGHVGIGTNEPNLIHGISLSGDVRHLNIRSAVGTARNIVQGGTAAESYLVHTEGLAGKKIVRTRVAGGKYLISTMSDDLASNTEVPFSIDLGTKNVGIKTASPTKPFQVGDAGANDGNGAHVTAGGVWTNASSRSVKDDIQPVSLDTARDTILALQPVTYRYKNEKGEQYVGFIAEDVPELVATQDRKSLAAMDITAVLTRVVQDQDRQLDEQRTTIAKLERTNTEQQSQISEQQALLAALNKRLTDLERTCGDRTEPTQSSASP